jgi:CrcB protein
MPIEAYFAVAAGGALGTLARYWLSGVIANTFGQTFPWDTLAINIAGSFAIGFFAALTGPNGRLLVGGTTRQFVIIGLCGGFTTFSAFSLQTLNLVNEGEWLAAGGNAVGSVVLCLAAAWLGMIAAAALNQIKGA